MENADHTACRDRYPDRMAGEQGWSEKTGSLPDTEPAGEYDKRK